MSKVFFDANILLDVLMPNRTNHALAVNAYRVLCDRYDTLATSKNILTTVEYIATKNGIECSVTSDFFKALEENFELYGFGEILSDVFEVYREGCLSGDKMDFEDMLQIECAVYHNCDAFVTQDNGVLRKDHKIQVLSLTDIVH